MPLCNSSSSSSTCACGLHLLAPTAPALPPPRPASQAGDHSDSERRAWVAPPAHQAGSEAQLRLMLQQAAEERGQAAQMAEVEDAAVRFLLGFAGYPGCQLGEAGEAGEALDEGTMRQRAQLVHRGAGWVLEEFRRHTDPMCLLAAF